MKRFFAIVCFFMSLILVFSGMALAQVQAGRFSIGPYLGGFSFDSERQIQNSLTGGLRLGYDISRYFGVEGTVGAFFTDYERATWGDKRVEGLNFRLEGIFNLLPKGAIVPFVAAGVGGQEVDYPRNVSNVHGATVAYGGGIKIYFTEDWLMRYDIRHIYQTKDALNDIEYSVGITYLFGGKAKTVTAVREEGLLAPINLQAWPKSQTENNLSWDPVSGAKSYRIYRDGKFVSTADMSKSVDAGLSPGTRYCYRVTAVDSVGKESPASNEACAITMARVVSAPTDITAKAISESQINVQWKESAGATEYKVYRDGNYLTTSKTPSLADMGLKSSTRYCYAVTAVGEDRKESELSRTACDETFAPPAEAKKAAEAKGMALTAKEEKAVAAVEKELKEKKEARINILFDFDKAVVKAKFHNELKKFAAVLLRNPSLHVVIEGHTDNVGTAEYNLKLSLRRAESVVKYLVEKFGVPASQLTAKGYGLSRPIASNKTKEGRAKNRRVMAVVDYEITK
ncbi:MAG TPA: OmpA family protein [Syntrophales bacterium]|nr:OmpA family protein [Syntrophales bacterium]HOL59068.1 OmpA family protein [Syntrophales bacterium]HPO35423.1 OmpA family protein [Syntrophales bacterium]